MDESFNSNGKDTYSCKEQEELSKLFYGRDQHGNQKVLHRITVGQAARVFRNYLFTGLTDWDLPDQ